MQAREDFNPSSRLEAPDHEDAPSGQKCPVVEASRVGVSIGLRQDEARQAEPLAVGGGSNA